MKRVPVLALLALVVFATIGRGSDTKTQQIEDVPIISWLKTIPQVGRDFTPEEHEGLASRGSVYPRIIGFGAKTIETGGSVDGQVTRYGESRGFGFGAEFPESVVKGTQLPQIMVFKLGLRLLSSFPSVSFGLGREIYSRQ